MVSSTCEDLRARCRRAVQPVPGMGNGAPGRKAHGGGKGRKNKDHRLHTLQRTIHKNRWDDICATELKVENYDRVVAEKTKLDPDLPGLGQYYCVACRRVLHCSLSCTLPYTSTTDPHHPLLWLARRPTALSPRPPQHVLCER